MADWELAQLNIARWIVDPEGPIAAEFMDQLDEINGRGDASPGWVWRMQDEGGDATDIPTPWGEDWIANLTVWDDVEALHAFTYRDPRHAEAMRSRRRWFEHPPEPTTVLWWVPAGHRPDLEEAAARLARLRSDGPTAVAFTFRDHFSVPS